MSEGQKSLVIVVFVLGLIPILFGKTAAFAVGCLYALLAAFFVGAFWGQNDAEGATENLWFFKVLGFVTVPSNGALLVVVFMTAISPIWTLFSMLIAGFTAACVLILVMLGFFQHTRDAALKDEGR